MVDTGILFSNMKSPFYECWVTFWPLTNSDFPTDQTFHQFNDLYTEFDLHRIMSGFHGIFSMGVACQQGTLTLPDTWFRPTLVDLHVFQLLRPDSLNLSCLYSTFHLEYILVLSRCAFYWGEYKTLPGSWEVGSLKLALVVMLLLLKSDWSAPSNERLLMGAV